MRLDFPGRPDRLGPREREVTSVHHVAVDRELPAFVIDGIGRNRVHLVRILPADRVQILPIRRRPYVRRIDRLDGKTKRRQRAGLRIEPERVDAFRGGGRRQRRMRIAADEDQIIISRRLCRSERCCNQSDDGDQEEALFHT